MKIDRNKLKKSTTDVPADCRPIIERLKNTTCDNLLSELTSLKNTTFGKCELYHWADVLDIFDDILEKSCKKETDSSWTLACDMLVNAELKTILLQVLNFTSTLIEHSFSRHLYNSMEHLTALLSSCDMTVVLEVLNLLYVFSKRSNFITRLGADKKQGLIVRLTHLAESWGGKDNGFGLAECCQDSPISNFPSSATTLHFEFYHENSEDKAFKKGSSNIVTSIHVENVDQFKQLPTQIMEELASKYKIPEDKQTLMYTHIRLAHLFSNYESRIQCVQARLQSIAILVYSNAIQENINSLLYPGFIEELVDIVELKNINLVEIKSAALRTLTSIIHLERNPKLNNIIDATGASSYHGFLPVLVRSCIQHMTDREMKPFPQPYATALFSFLYHLASYENGVEALVSCGMMESLLKVINWYGEGHDHITFATRAVRVVDLITNLDMAAFQTQGGLIAFINRLEHEACTCRAEQPFEICPNRMDSSMDLQPESPPLAMETDTALSPEDGSRLTSSLSEPEGAATSDPQPTTSSGSTTELQPLPDYSAAKTGRQCFPQRAALLKSMLNFLKKAIPDPSFSESMRHLMEGSLPKSLKHIISNAEYYGPSLFLLATDVVTVYVFQEPSLLSSLQDNGLTDVVLHALLIKDVPATREVLASLPNVFSALCLNARGLESFVKCRPFDRLFKVLLSPDYLPAMRRRRSADPFGDTASNLGNAMDELMRHQPSLRTDATKAIIKLLQEVNMMGRDKKYVCQKPQPKTEQMLISLRSPQAQDGGSSDEEEDEEEMAAGGTQQESQPDTQESESKSSLQIPTDTALPATSTTDTDKQAIPLMDYVLNVMKFVEAILSNNSTDDHCREFVTQKGLPELMDILGLPNLPVEFPASPACQAVASVCKAILTLLRDPHVLEEGLKKLNEVLGKLEHLHQPLEAPGGSVLLQELASVSHIPDATLCPTATPLLHALSSAHAYIMMFVHVCRMGQTDIRTISVSHWGSELGLKVLDGLSKLYTSLVWESTVLLALCSEDILPAGCEFGKADMDKLLPKDFKVDGDDGKEEAGLTHSSGALGSNGVSHAMESLSTSDTPVTMDTEEGSSSDKDGKKPKLSPTLQAQVKQLKPLLSVSSRLGRALAELFGLLVKLSVGTRVRQRGSQMLPTMPIIPTPAAQSVAKALTKLLTEGLKWEPPAYSPVPKLRLTFLVCSVGFTSPMLFDDKKQPYHLMLQKFLASGGQDTLFQAFSWALSVDGRVALTEGLEDPQLPAGTGEFLDAWLMLIEKMVNPKTVLETPHQLPNKSSQPGFQPFNPVQYLISTQKAAFGAVMNLWNKKPLKVYGSRMSESVLAILCHIIKGEGIIREHLAKDKAIVGDGGTAAPSGATGTGPAPSASGLTAAVPAAVPAVAAPSSISRPRVNETHVQQLMEMGFTRARCVDALVHTQSIEEATDYLLTQVGDFPPPVQNLSGIDMELSEDQQMLQAIAMSLGQDVQSDETNDEKKKETEKKTEEEEEKQNCEEPLDKTVLDDFTAKLFPGCLTLLDTLPETVYRVCELLTVVTQRNGIQWQNMVLNTLVEEVKSLAKSILSLSTPSDLTNNLAQTEASKFAVRIHLFSLLFEETMMPCAEALETNNLTDLLVQVMAASKDYLLAVKNAPTPKWLAPLLLLLDLYEKVSVISKRKAEAEKTLINCHTWKWFDDTSGRWCKYNTGNNKTIDDAYQAGETSIRFTAGRRRYTVHFSSMVQVNEETSNRRPIMLTYPMSPELKQSNEKKEDNTGQASLENKMDMDTESPSTSSEKKETVVVSGLTSHQISNIISSIVSIISAPVEAETLHAALRLILRLTREHKFALQFAELGGPKLLLGLTQASAFQGFLSLTILIFRHILEEPASLRYCMEKVIKSSCSGAGSSLNGVSQRSVGAKEMHYVMRVLSPAACRNPQLFAELSKECMRIALPPPSKRDEDESRFTGPNAPQILKCIATKQMAVTTIQFPMKDVIESLLDALVVKYSWNTEDGNGNSSEAKSSQSLAEAIQEVVNEINERHSEITRQNSTAEILQTEDDQQATAEGGGAEVAISKIPNKEVKTVEEKANQRPLLPKSSLLRMLSEIIKSYCNCTQLITQYMYHAGQSDLVPEDCSVLAFVLDHLLHQNSNTGDRDCPALSRVFIASIASCNHSPEAQLTLVSEVKSALQRALALPESSEKHSRVQSLTGIISTIIESCPTQGQIPNQVFKGQQNIMNNIVKNLLKRGLVTDLARIPYSLDLSSPFMAATINAALKPLETLSRSVNQPVQNVSAKPKTKSETETAGSSSQANTTTPNTQEASAVETAGTVTGEGEVEIQEILNTEHTEEGDLEETHQDSVLEPSGPAAELDSVIDNLLERDRSMDPESQVIGEIIMETDQSQEDVLVDVDIEEGEVDDHHDSAMLSQLISEGEGEDICILDRSQNITDQLHDGDETADSASDADDDNDDDGDDDDDDDDDDDPDEEDNDDDDDEGSDMEADNDDYQDIENPMGRPFSDAFVIHTDEMFPPVPNIPPAPSNVTATHPLLVRQADSQAMGLQRGQRGRQRGTCRFNPSTQTLHVNLPRQPNPPVILQRLLGPTTAADVLQLTNTLSTQAGPTHTRVVLSNNDLRIISRPEEDILEELFQDSYPESGGSMGMSTLSTIPNTLTRWTEEAKVLDGDSVHDCMAALKPEIVELLEKGRDEELAERREKRKKATEEELVKKADDKTKKTAANNEMKMEVSPNAFVEDLSTGGAGTLDVSNIPLPITTTGSTTTSTAQGQISASEAAAAAEVIAEQMVEEVLSAPGGMPIPPPFDGLQPPGGGFQAMPPLPRHDLITPMSVQNLPTSAQIFAPPTVPVPTPTLPGNVSSSQSQVSLTPSLTNAPLSSSGMQLPSPFDGLDMSQISTPIQQFLGVPLSSPFSNVPPAASYTPANQAIEQSTPMAPRLDRFPTGQSGSSNLSEIFQSYLRSSHFPETPLTSGSVFGAGGPNLHLASLLLPDAEGTSVDAPPPSSTEPPGGGGIRTDSDSGVITPEEVSNITSSDAATVHSSTSESPQEINPDRMLANLASVTDGAAPITTTNTSGTTDITPPSSQPVAGSSSSSGSSAPESGVPDGLDPSFLAALPENIRAEVIADHLRMQRIQQRRDQISETPGGMEVNPEFLAALPPAIQEEVLAQQRIEQERLTAQTNATANPEAPVDPASFFATLPSTLRQSVLADMDDSMVAVLPADLAAEAQSLRRELEDRHRRIMQERLFTQPGSGGSLSSILRHAGSLRYTLGRGPRSGQNFFGGGRIGSENAGYGSTLKLRGRHLLDHEALTCLLVLLFVDEPKLNTGRLHRVMRNLCYHGPTRSWVIRSLLSILTRTGENRVDVEDRTKTPEKTKLKKSQQQMQTDTYSASGSSKVEARSQGSWLSISLEAALGCRANVFQIQRTTGGKKHSTQGNGFITVHPQASPVVCRHVLDALISLAKMFPNQFLPSKAKEVQKCDTEKDKESDNSKSKSSPVLSSGSSTPKLKNVERQDSKPDNRDTDFWENLIKLDSLCNSKKGKSVQRTHSSLNSEHEPGYKDYDSSPLGQLMTMLSHPVIKRSQLLTDRLLRLLGLVSTGLSESDRTGAGVVAPPRSGVGAASGAMPQVVCRRIVCPQTPSRVSDTVSRGTNTADNTSVVDSEKDKAESEKKEPEKEIEEPAVLENQLHMAVQVLTSKSCSEEGLEDATSLLLQLSWANNATRSAVLHMLLSGARELGLTVCQHIRNLLKELRTLNQKLSPDGETDDGSMDSPASGQGKGILHDRFSGMNVVVTAPKKLKSGRELQLPSMSSLTSKASSQQFFLRILKVIIQLRDAARSVNKKNQKKPSTGSAISNSQDLRQIGEAMAMLEAEADAIMQFVTRREGGHPSSAVEINIQENEDRNTPDSPHVPPVHGAVGLNNAPPRDLNEEVVAEAEPTQGEHSEESPMETDKPGPSSDSESSKEEGDIQLPRLSDQIDLEELWFTLGECLSDLDKTPDHHAVLILQPAVEAFFLVHAGEKDNKNQDNKPAKREDQLAHLNMDMPPSPQPSSSDNPGLSRENSVQAANSMVHLPPDTQKFLKFAETHRTVLNQILRQSTTPLADGPFSVLVDHTRILDFDVKRRYFRQDLERLDEGIRREDLAVHVRREHVFEDSFRELFRRTPEEWKHRFYIVFEGEDGQDAGGLLREWYIIIAREIFNPMYALFCTSPGDRVTYTINQSSHCNSNHLSYFKFVGRIIAKAIYDNKLMECYFTRSFYNHIIGVSVKYTDMESEDYAFYQGLVFLLEHDIKDIGYEITFSTEIMEFGVSQSRDLIPNGRNIPVTEDRKAEYVKLLCQMKMTGAIRQQLNAFMEGFYDIIPKKLISIFNEQELELLISGLPTIDIEDLKSNTEYHKYQPTSLQILWFWRALRSFDQAERARFLQFVTGTSKVPLQGFAHLEGMNGTQKFQIHKDDRSTDRLPAAHTCFNQLDLPAYETYDKLRHMLLLAITECSEGFGLA